MARILVVDDELDIVETLKYVLEANGHEVFEANDGMEGLDQARSIEPDVILLDVMMPKLDGYKVCRMLKFDSQYKDIPIVLLTARSGSQDLSIGEEVGADEYLTKPFDVEEVVTLIARLVNGGSNTYSGGEVE
jgi:DNA-binding response OmpR family regulator